MLAQAGKPRAPARQGVVHQPITVLPPVRGINSTGAVAGMPATDALEMDNFISTDLGVTVREGYYEYAIGIGGGAPIKTIMSAEDAPDSAITPPLVSSTLFAATDLGIWDIEGGGDFAAAAPEIALSGGVDAGRFSHVQFTADGGTQYLVACSEVDGAFLWNGTSWMKMAAGGGPGPGHIDGVDPALFVQVCAYKKRLMFVQRASGLVWILGPGAVGGTAEEFDFGPLLQHGGSVLALANWTQDAGEGTDDRLVIIGTSGDLLIYQGNDPTDAAEFSNAGIWFIGQPPVGRRCYTTSGGNVFVLTEFGVIPVGQVVQGGMDNILTSDTDYLQQLRKIQDALNRDFRTLLNTPGWELQSVPSKALLQIARPAVSVTEHVQYAFQQHNMAWSRFLDVPAVTFARRLSEFYGGTDDGRVLRLLDGGSDGMTLAGTGAHEIRSRLTPAFSYFGSPTLWKQALMIRLNFVSGEAPGYQVLMNSDFALFPLPGNPPANTVLPGSLWDTALWDQAFWSGGRAAFGEWRSVEGAGYALTPTIFLTSTQRVTLANIEYLIKAGGLL